MTRSIMVGEVRTGRRITQIPVKDAKWSTVHRGAGTITIDIPLGASDFRGLEQDIIAGLWPSPILHPSPDLYPTADVSVWRAGDGLRPEFLAALDPARCFLAVLEGDEVLEAGPIWFHDFDLASNTLTVKAAGLRSLFDHRIVMGLIADGVAAAEWTQTYTGLSLGTIAKRLVALAMSHTGGNLPIVLPDDETGTSERTYYGYELGPLGDRLDQLMGVIDGPDIAFTPRLTEDRMGIEWVMRVGTVADPLLHQSSGEWVWDSRVPRGGVSGISVSRDATGMAERAWMSGAGMQTSRLIEFDTDPTLLDAGFPLLESREDRGTVEDRATLARWVEGNLAAGSRPWMTWTFTARADSSPRLGSFRPGDFARVWIPTDHPYLSLLLPEGFHRARVLEVSGGMGEDVTVKLAPGMESR